VEAFFNEADALWKEYCPNFELMDSVTMEIDGNRIVTNKNGKHEKKGSETKKQVNE
jgi:hypothetical protein